MLDEARSKAQLVAELEAARMRVAALERAQSQSMETEQALRRSENLLSSILNTARDAIVSVDETQQIVLFSRSAERIFGYSADEIMGQPLDTLIPPRFVENHRSHVQSFSAASNAGRHLAAEGGMWGYRKDGTEFPMSCAISVTKFSGQKLLTSIVRDLSEPKRAEQALKESEERYRTFFENTSDAIFILDPQREEIIDVNSKACDMLGYTREELLSLTPSAVHPNDLPELRKFMSSVLESGYGSTTALSCVAKSGRALPTEISATSIELNGGPYIVYLVRDMTERNLLQSQLLQAAKLSSIGTFITGVAHEVNNPLAGALGRVDLMLRRDLDETLKGDIQLVRDETMRAVRIMQNLNSFSRQHQPEKTYTSINEIVENILELLIFQLRVSNVEVVKDLQPNLPRTMADADQLRQVFFNLIANAEQAMAEAHGQGTLIVKTYRSEETIYVTIEDDGPGILEEHLPRIFDPFFTTKAEGKGTGLGLSISYGIVQEHGGDIHVDSQVGKGATFTVQLPLATEGLPNH